MRSMFSLPLAPLSASLTGPEHLFGHGPSFATHAPSDDLVWGGLLVDVCLRCQVSEGTRV